MEITLRKFQSNAALSQETNAYFADVYVDGVKAFHAHNDGHGGMDVFIPYGAHGKKLLELASEWAKTLPPITHPDFTHPLPCDLDIVITLLVIDTIRIRWERRACRKYTVIMEYGSETGNYIQYKRPYSPEMKELVLKEHPGCRIVNEDYLV